MKKLYKIDSVVSISGKEFSENDESEHTIRHREVLIDDLFRWITEASDNDKEMMKEDLKYLMSIKDGYILSSTQTNEYIRENSEEGQAILKEIYNN